MNHFEKVVIRASAGSGKTYQLSNRYIRLLFDGVSVDQILAVTFTRLAAGEISNRIFSRLGKAALSDEQTQALVREVYGSDTGLSRKDVILLLQRLIQNLHRLRISTLDAFGNQMAKSFSMELGLPVDWDLCEEVNVRQIRALAVLKTLRNMNTHVALKLMNMLSKGESSKRVADDLDSTVKNMIGFVRQSTLQAWTKLSHRPIPDMSVIPDLVERLRNAPIPMTKATKKDPGHPNMQIYGNPRNNLVESVCADDIQGILGNPLVKRVRNNTLEANASLGDLATTVDAVSRIMEPRAINLLADNTGSLYPVVSRVAAYMDELKYELGQYEFDDVTRRLARWVASVNNLEGNPTDQLVFRLDAATKHLFLDEFQDTSLDQWRFIYPFVESILSRPSGTSFFCVGDIKQAIYGWRNGLAEIFNRVERLVNERTSEQSAISNAISQTPSQSLVVNYRSCGAVIDTVNELFGSLRVNESLIGETGKNEVEIRKNRAAIAAADHWSQGFEPHETAKREGVERNGLVTVEVAPLYENDPDRMRQIFSELDPKGMLVNWDDIDSGILSSRSGPKLLALATAVARVRQIYHDIPGASIGIVTRTNDTIRKIATALRGYGIEVDEEGGSPLHNVASVRTLLAMLSLADHPGDSVALYQVASVAPLAAYWGISFDESEWKQAGQRISSVLRERIAARGLGAVVAEFADLLMPLCNEREAERLNRVCELGWTTGSVCRVDSFIELIRLKKRAFSRPSVVEALTIHTAKGLEFDVVVLPDLYEEFFQAKSSTYVGRDSNSLDVDTVLVGVNQDLQYLLPQSPVDFKMLIQNQWQNEMEESLCNLYVAITRAAYQLCMIVPSSKDGKYTSRTYANIIRAGLNIQDGNNSLQPAIVYSHGDAQWWKKTKFVARNRQTDRCLKSSDEVLTRIASSQNAVDRTFYLSPSQSTLLKWSPPRAYLRGTALHRCFQEVKWLDRDGLPEECVLIDVLEQLPGPKVDAKAVVAEFKRQCERPEVRNALSLESLQNAESGLFPTIDSTLTSNASNWEVQTERPYTFTRPDGLLARGTIDRLVLLRDHGQVVGAEILDYKSDRLEDFDPCGTMSKKNALLLEKYFRQLGAYEDIVRQWYRLRPEMISKKLLFVSHGIVVPVPTASQG